MYIYIYIREQDAPQNSSYSQKNIVIKAFRARFYFWLVGPHRYAAVSNGLKAMSAAGHSCDTKGYSHPRRKYTVV